MSVEIPTRRRERRTPRHTRINEARERSPTELDKPKLTEFEGFVDVISKMIPRKDRKEFMRGVNDGEMFIKFINFDHDKTISLSDTTLSKLLKRGYEAHKEAQSTQAKPPLPFELMDLLENSETERGKHFVNSITDISNIDDERLHKYVGRFEESPYRRGMSLTVTVNVMEEEEFTRKIMQEQQLARTERAPIPLLPNLPLPLAI